MLESFPAKRLNKILGVEAFKNIAHNDEVKRLTGLSIKELLHAFIFSSRNNFNQELTKWQETKEPMSINRIWQKSI